MALEGTLRDFSFADILQLISLQRIQLTLHHAPPRLIGGRIRRRVGRLHRPAASPGLSIGIPM